MEVTAPTVVISNSEGNENGSQDNSSNEASHANGDGVQDTSEQVTIAAIEAERDVALAEIHSDVERERIAVEAERVEAIEQRNQEIEECRMEINRLTGIVETLMDQVNSLIPPPQLVEVVTEELPTVPEQDLIQPSIVVPTPETTTEHLEENADESLTEEILNPVRKFIAI